VAAPAAPETPRPHAGPLLVALGTSLGDRRDLLRRAARALDGTAGIRVVACSGIYDTAPAGGVAVQRFLNAAVRLETTLAPEPLLDALLAAEASLGRRRPQRWADRTMDLDLVLWGDRVIDTSRLRVPHPELHRRRFVLAPAVDLAPHARHPLLGQTLSQLLEKLPDPPGGCVLAGQLTLT
jgi:2-amino-4-hydroxy-6-hydroxymethyldihydropteridine diphosphokinase